MSDETKLSRRGFVKGTSLLASAAALLEAAGAEAAAGQARTLGPDAVKLQLTVNGDRRDVMVEPRATLASVLRDQLQLTGTKIGCDRGACGACTVMVGDKPVPSCMTFALDVAGAPITTIEGLARGEQLSPLQAAFVAHDALQCGFCTPGMVMSCHALLQHNPHPSDDEVRRAVAGNTCRCGTYPKVFEAVLAASGTAPAAIGPAQGELTAADEMPAASSGGSTGERTFKVGLPGALAERTRKVPADEPAAWDGSANLKVVGQPTPRIDGPEKVTGRARYAFDVQLPGMLHATLVRSPHAHARIRSVDTTAAGKMPGVQAVYVVERILGPAELKLKAAAPGRYPLVRYEGAPVVGIAALTEAQAEDAARAVRVDYEVLPHVADIDLALKPGAPLVFEGAVEQAGTAGGGGAAKDVAQSGNLRGPVLAERGDVEAGLRQSDVVVEQEYRTEVQTHSAIETHGAVAHWRDDGVTLYASTQGIHSVQDEIAKLFQLPKSNVRVISEFTGGGFGAKFGAGNYGVIALHLSRLAKKPVRLFLDRRAEHLSVGNRPSSVQKLRVGAAKDGQLLALHLHALGSAGCAAGAGCAGPVKNLYPAKAARTEEYDVFLHTGPSAAFRAPGHPQGAFGLEQAMDELADKLGIDPVDLRDRNDAHPARREERRVGREKFGWSELRRRKDKGSLRRGVGFAQGLWYNFDGGQANAEVIIHDDGSVECRSGVADIGGGIRTACAQVVAEVLGVKPQEVRVHIGDTALPEGPASGGSQTTQMLTPAVRLAAERAKADLGGAPLRKPGRTIRGYASRVRDYGGWNDNDKFTATIGGAQFVEVEVDTETGIVRVLRAVAVHDCGRPVNRLGIVSQINGGIVQGVSYALHERRVMDLASGRMMNSDLEHYRIVGARDVPEIEAIVLEHFRGRSNTDVSGIGEPATVPTCAAIANAVAHATGARVRSIPITPARVLAALKGEPG
ncbi:MAG TPA: molybdopterin-dependent oxidoreductase [Myxococcales bacterium]|nr:molybdopterin-dependent oxidoreductase [Myxococcales bacterium]